MWQFGCLKWQVNLGSTSFNILFVYFSTVKIDFEPSLLKKTVKQWICLPNEVYLIHITNFLGIENMIKCYSHARQIFLASCGSWCCRRKSKVRFLAFSHAITEKNWYHHLKPDVLSYSSTLISLILRKLDLNFFR